jgi:hypothetical protein
MATLYVRNVPEDLYERLRAQAEGHGRSIANEAVELLEMQLLQRRGRGLRRRRDVGSFARFGAEARQVIVSAAEEARSLAHTYIGTEHLLLGTLTQVPLPGLDLGRARHDIEERVGRGTEAVGGSLPFTPRAKRALELAVGEAGLADVTPGHLALGLLAEGEGVAFEMLRAAGVDADAVWGAMGPEQAALHNAAPFRVVELRGDATEWERALSEAGLDDYELVSVTDGRAVLRRL